MKQYKKYLEDNYTKSTVETYFKGITIFNDFLNGREIEKRLLINLRSIYWKKEKFP